MPPTIEVLIDETDPYPGGYHYLIWALKVVWDLGDYTVRVARGLSNLRGADLVIPHLDLTVTPDEVRRVLDGLPAVLNPGLYDISKRRFSENLLGPEEDYEQPVVVKTDRNYGGGPERRREYHSRTVPQKAFRKLKRILRREGAEQANAIEIQGCQYPIFETLSSVPREVFEDPDLVVERFLPEEEDGHFYIRWYMFFGDRYKCIRVASIDPIVKAEGMVTREEGQPVPKEVLDLRHEFQMDFGKIDFTMHAGKPVILDVNRTPGGPPRERALERTSEMALGVDPLLTRGAGPYRPMVYQDVSQEQGEETSW